jgi:hypothetical protein
MRTYQKVLAAIFGTIVALVVGFGAWEVLT